MENISPLEEVLRQLHALGIQQKTLMIAFGIKDTKTPMRFLPRRGWLQHMHWIDPDEASIVDEPTIVYAVRKGSQRILGKSEHPLLRVPKQGITNPQEPEDYHYIHEVAYIDYEELKYELCLAPKADWDAAIDGIESNTIHLELSLKWKWLIDYFYGQGTAHAMELEAKERSGEAGGSEEANELKKLCSLQLVITKEAIKLKTGDHVLFFDRKEEPAVTAATEGN